MPMDDISLDVGTQSRIAVHGRVNFVKVDVDALGVAELQGLRASSAEIVMTTGASAELRVHKSVNGTIDAGSHLRLLRDVEEMNLMAVRSSSMRRHSLNEKKAPSPDSTKRACYG